MKRLLVFSVAAAILITGGVFFWTNRPSPAIETKFVTDVRKEITPTIGELQDSGNAQSSAGIKKPGNSALVTNPRHIYQTFNNCGPATLSMVLGWYGRNVSQSELADKMRPYQNQKGDNDDKTIFTYEFVDWVKEYGFEATGRVNGDIELLKKFTTNGIPVVVKTWLHVNEDIGHFRIVRGFDESKKVIIQDDSYEGPNMKFSYYDFLSLWQPFNYAYIIVYKQEQESLVEAILGSEIDEKVAWENALERAERESQLSQDSVYPWFNMSTAYYHLEDYQNSVTAFEKVEDRLPKRMLWYQIEPIQSYQKLGKYDRVFTIIAKVLENGNRAYSELYQIRGEIYLDQGKKDLAKNVFEQALAYNKYFKKAQVSLENISNN